MRERESYRELILENIEYDYLIQNHRLDRDRLDELVELMVDTVCSNREMIRIAGDDYPAEVVKQSLIEGGFDASFADTLFTLVTPATYPVIILLCFVCGVIGAFIGRIWHGS